MSAQQINQILDHIEDLHARLAQQIDRLVKDLNARIALLMDRLEPRPVPADESFRKEQRDRAEKLLIRVGVFDKYRPDTNTEKEELAIYCLNFDNRVKIENFLRNQEETIVETIHRLSTNIDDVWSKQTPTMKDITRVQHSKMLETLDATISKFQTFYDTD